MRAFVFPGQGSQYIGMGTELALNFKSAQEIFQEIDEALSFKLFQLMSNGTSEELQLTVNAQPALFAVSAAILAVLEKDFNFTLKDQVQFIAGHSLGEYSAYYAGQSLSLTETACILKERGKAMQEAVPLGTGGMRALIGASFDQAQDLIHKVTSSQAVCEIANDNAPGQIIISGHLQALELLQEAAIEMGLKRMITLPVSAPFHCSLMTSAAQHMTNYLQKFDIKIPQISLFSNVTASQIKTVTEIKPSLINQITGRVRWRETINNMCQLGLTQVVEIGAGKVLSGLNKRINSQLEIISLEGPQAIEQWIETID